MRIRTLLFLGVLALPLVGCSSYNTNQGATTDEYNATSSAGESNPQPAASPTFRPGMNTEDPRDSHFTTRPQPSVAPPTTNP